MAFESSQAPGRPVAIPISFTMSPRDKQPEPVQPEAIQSSQEYIQHLRNLVHVRSDLQKSGYVVHQLSQDDLNRKRRCGRCGRRKCYTGRDVGQSDADGHASRSPSQDEEAHVAAKDARSRQGRG